MADELMLILCPSRERPGQLANMMDAALDRSGPGTHIAVGYDDDDPQRQGYAELADAAREKWPGRTFWHRGPRRSLVAWVNWLASWPRSFRYPYLAFLGDDHFARTYGWDETLTAAIAQAGGTGIGYGDDKHQGRNLPTAPIISADIPRALGWFFLPGLFHMYADDALKHLGERAGCLVYVEDVVIEHLHPDAGKNHHDATYASGYSQWGGDRQAYTQWLATLAEGDVETVQGLMTRKPAVAP